VIVYAGQTTCIPKGTASRIRLEYGLIAHARDYLRSNKLGVKGIYRYANKT